VCVRSRSVKYTYIREAHIINHKGCTNKLTMVGFVVRDINVNKFILRRLAKDLDLDVSEYICFSGHEFT